ncbi:uncharacterized protein TNCV_1829791 [Trichonephila clavipes]|nr:uncharacterized protein TNCV_1829791 [Trichonephila clavipes]
MTQSGESIKNSRIVDLFSYLMRNSKKQVEPKHFEYFLQALKEKNVPHSCISNQKVLDRLKYAKGGVSYASDDREDSKREHRRSKSLVHPTSWKQLATQKLATTKCIDY